MTEVDIAALVREGMLVMLKLGGPPLIAGLAVGLVVALLQAVTQINEQTLAFVPKALAVGFVMVLLGSFMTTALSDYTRLLLDRMVAVGGS